MDFKPITVMYLVIICYLPAVRILLIFGCLFKGISRRRMVASSKTLPINCIPIGIPSSAKTARNGDTRQTSHIYRNSSYVQHVHSQGSILPSIAYAGTGEVGVSSTSHFSKANIEVTTNQSTYLHCFYYSKHHSNHCSIHKCRA